MKIEHGTNEQGEPTISVSIPIPATIDPKDYDRFADVFARQLSQDLIAELRRRVDREWLQMETKG